MRITSRSNEHVKQVRALERARERRETGLHVIEGEKILEEAVENGMELREVFVVEGNAIRKPYDACVHQVTESVMQAMSDLVTPPGVLAVVKTPDLTPPEVYPKGVIVALDRLQDPGNVGTIIRTADAMGAAGVLISKDTTDPFGGKTLRAAMGSTYHLPLWVGDVVEELRKLKAAGALLVAGDLEGEETLPPPAEQTVLVIGNEGAGISKSVAALCQGIRIPMKGRAESLNASVAAGILLYEFTKRMD
ncbi:MAG: RNA methyltransferase [Clostridia bacterium]|nr:RNA methyltransferase [Clostridia bacterium]